MNASRYSVRARLRDGSPVRIRSIRPTDREALIWGFAQLSPETVYHRFFQAKRGLSDREVRYLTELDFVHHVALVAEAMVDGVKRVIGVGRFVRLGAGDNRAETAFIVGDRFQGRGIGTLLLAHLVRIARELGFAGLTAEVMPDNLPMLAVFEHSGLALTRTLRDGVVHVELGLPPPTPPPQRRRRKAGGARRSAS